MLLYIVPFTPQGATIISAEAMTMTTSGEMRVLTLLMVKVVPTGLMVATRMTPLMAARVTISRHLGLVQACLAARVMTISLAAMEMTILTAMAAMTILQVKLEMTSSMAMMA